MQPVVFYWSLLKKAKTNNNMNRYKNYLSIKLLAMVFLISPGLALSSCIDSAIEQEQERNVGPFTGIKVGGAFNVILSQTGNHKVVIEAEQDIIDKVRTEVKGGVLYINMEWDWSWKGHDNVLVYIDFKDLESLNISDAGDVMAETPIKADDLDIRVSGAGDLDLEVNAISLEVEVTGAGDVNIAGTTNSQKIKLSGAGDYEARNLISNYTYAKASGAGNVVVHVLDEIEAYASGAGSVKYYGDPPMERTNASGAGSVSKR